MQIIKYLFFLAPLISVNLLAQQPAWELVRQDFWGKIAIDPTNPDIIYVSPGHVPEYGLHKSSDGGKTWVNYQQGYEGMATINGIVIDPNNPQRFWIYGGAGRGVTRSETGGITAVKSDTGIYIDHHGYSVCAFAYDSKRNILYAGDFSAGGIYRSFNGGRNWQLILPYGGGLGFNPLYFMVEEDSGWVYSGTWGHGLWRSKNFGISWAPLDPEVLGGQPLGERISLIGRVPNSRTLYAAGGLGTSYNMGKIYKSYDLGEKWFIVSDVTTDSSELSGGLLVSSLDTNYVYVGGRGGAAILKGGFFLSRDGGKKWELYHLGLPQYSLSQYRVWSLTQTGDSKYLYMSLLAGDQSKFSIYRLSQPLLTSVQEHPSSSPLTNFSLRQNYPNPFNAQTKIEFSVVKKNLVILEIYNITGARVVCLFNKQLNSGSHTVIWNGKDTKGGDVVSGIYLFRLQVGKTVLIRKALLIR